MQEPRLSTLDNGLVVLLDPNDSAPVVGIALYYDVGSRNEQPGTSGFAHLFEHLMFEGSAHVGKTEHFKLIQGFGGQLNATTSQDRTNYYESLPAHQLALGLWLEADRMRALAVTPENFENQRQTVMEERRQRVDDAPYGQAGIEFSELSYECWAYAHSVIGSWEDLHGARFEQVRDFHDLWYKPDNAVMAISGDIYADEAMSLVTAYFGDIPRGAPRPTPDLYEPRRKGGRVEKLVAPLAQLPAAFISHQAPSHTDPDFYVAEVMEALLFTGHSSRLYRKLIIEQQLAVDIGGGYEARRGPSLFTLYAVAARGASLERLADGYQAELDRLCREPVGAEELTKIRNQLGAARVMGNESALSRALALGRAQLYTGDPSWEARYLDRIAAVTPDDITRVARSWLDGNTSVQLQVLPA